MPADVKEDTSDELLVGEGEVQLLEQDGKFYLSQGEVAVDITGILLSTNHAMGRAVLNIRVHNHPGNFSSNESREWLRDEMQRPGPKVDANQEEGFTKVSGAELVQDDLNDRPGG